MKQTIQKEQVPSYRKTMAGIERYAEIAASEVFKWLGWSTAIAAIIVVAERTHSSWIALLPYVLPFFVAARIQWIFGLRNPEVEQPDGSLVIELRLWRTLFMMIVPWAITLLFAWALASQIAASDLLPEKVSGQVSK